MSTRSRALKRFRRHVRRYQRQGWTLRYLNSWRAKLRRRIGNEVQDLFYAMIPPRHYHHKMKIVLPTPTPTPMLAPKLIHYTFE